MVLDITSLLDDPDMAPVMQGLLDATPLGCMGQPKEIVSCIRFLLSSGASYVCARCCLLTAATMPIPALTIFNRKMARQINL
ncbi:MAG: hypothetical protein ACR2P1_09300 [Pseudomonadales bacterium]